MTKCVEQENFKTQTKEVQRNQYDAENFRYGVEENGEQTYFITDGMFSQKRMRIGTGRSV